MPMIPQVCHHLCCSQVEKSCVCLPFATADLTLLHLPLYALQTLSQLSNSSAVQSPAKESGDQLHSRGRAVFH